jgi:hypothetical protein
MPGPMTTETRRRTKTRRTKILSIDHSIFKNSPDMFSAMVFNPIVPSLVIDLGKVILHQVGEAAVQNKITIMNIVVLQVIDEKSTDD